MSPRTHCISRSLRLAPTALLALVAAAAAAPELRPAPPAVVPETRPEPTRVETTVTVLVDNAKIIRLPERTQTVIVGNPSIADVTLQKNGVLVLTGKSYGVTNLIALDPSGTMLAESLISVRAPSEAVVTVQRGLERESYSCTPSCQPSLLLGDANRYFSEVGGQADQRSASATKR